MARPRIKEPTPPNGFVASAARLPTTSRREAGRSQGWQHEAWSRYDDVPELRYLANWQGNAISRATIHAAKRVGDRLVKVTEGPAFEAAESLCGGPQGQQQANQRMGTHLTVAGDCYLWMSDTEWDVLSVKQVTQEGEGKSAKVSIDRGDGKRPLGSSESIIRVWHPHPTDPKKADSPTRSNLGTLRLMLAYDQHIATQLESRLAGAGVWLIPSEIDFAPDPDADPEADAASFVMGKLHEAMEAAKEDRNSPAAHVPIVFTIPGELIPNQELVQFWSELDDAVVEMRDSATRRLAIGMDAPVEQLMGLGEANHWNAWLSEDATIKSLLEPKLSVVMDALTTQYLRPSLKGTEAEQEADLYYMIADTAPLRVRPNVAQNALELWGAGLLEGDKVLSETGFDPADRLKGEEFVNWLLTRIATGAVTPELTAQALRLLGAKIDPSTIDGPPQDQPTNTKVDVEVDRTDEPGPPDRDERDERNRQDAERQMAAACEVLVFRALERAGNKLKNHHNGATTKMAADSVYMSHTGDHDQLLDGAWECAPRVLAQYDIDVPEVVDTLDFYVRGLLSTRKEHNRRTMIKLLQNADVPVG